VKYIDAPWLTALAGISLADVKLTIPDGGLTERGALLITHAGLSGPAVLRASAWGARTLHARQYRFQLKVDWLPHLAEADLAGEFERRRSSEANRLVVNTPLTPLPARLWEALVLAAGLPRQTRWAHLFH